MVSGWLWCYKKIQLVIIKYKNEQKMSPHDVQSFEPLCVVAGLGWHINNSQVAFKQAQIHMNWGCTCDHSGFPSYWCSCVCGKLLGELHSLLINIVWNFLKGEQSYMEDKITDMF